MKNPTLKQLIEQTDWILVAKELWDYIGEIELNNKFSIMGKYEKMFEELKIKVEPSYDYIRFIKIETIEGNEEEDIPDYEDISLYDPQSQENYSSALTEWRHWLGFEIHANTIRDYNPEEIIANCMQEMSWDGFTQESTELVINELTRRYRDAEKEILKHDQT